ncbi:unnamed protein product, partial [Musa acuminata var. zebrina]
RDRCRCVLGRVRKLRLCLSLSLLPFASFLVSITPFLGRCSRSGSFLPSDPLIRRFYLVGADGSRRSIHITL